MRRHSIDRRTMLGWVGFFGIMAGVFLLIDVIRGGGDALGAAKSPAKPNFENVSSFGQNEINQLDTWLNRQVERCKYPSLAVAIIRDGEIVYSKAFGFENVGEKRAATPNTQYHVASVTKAFTATLAVMLHERGVVDLDKPALDYLPERVAISTTPKVGATITLRQLASHTSGLPRGVPGQVQTAEQWYELEPQRLYDHLADVELNAPPGSQEDYSNLGFGLLGHVLECAADKPLDRLLQELICSPLGLQRTAIPVDDSLRPAAGYDSSTWRAERTHSLRERLAGSGGLVTSVTDLATFLDAQMKPGAFSDETLQQLHSEVLLAGGAPSGQALGWSVRSRPSVGRILKKNGGRSNCDAWMGFAPDHRVGVAIVTNCGGPDVDPMGYWLLERSVPRKLYWKGGYAKVAPFTGVRWKNGLPVVRVKDAWSPLVSIDGIPIEKIIEFSEQTFGDKARKRFAEDLVELLVKMGHQPEWNVTLGLRTESGTVQNETVPMTEENRTLVRE